MIYSNPVAVDDSLRISFRERKVMYSARIINVINVKLFFIENIF